MAADILSERELRVISVGIDIGSATTHLVFSALHLAKRGSRYVTVGYDTLFESPILLTPYEPGGGLDGARLAEFFREQHAASGIEVAGVDTGALILTGAALLRENAHAVVRAVGHAAGRLVAVSAGDSLEATMSAYGSGAVARSRQTGARVLNIDVGGGTTKLALCADGRIEAIATLDAGARLVATDAGGVVTRLEATGAAAARAAGVPVELGAVAPAGALAGLAGYFAAQILAASPLGRPDTSSPLLRGPALPADRVADVVLFSGGVAEYVYERQRRSFGDLGPLLAARLRDGVEAAGAKVATGGAGIRATVVGAGRYTAQVSGSTIYLSDAGLLPLRDVPVIAPGIDFDAELTAAAVTEAVAAGLARADAGAGRGPVALALDWSGSATYDRLDALCRGIDTVLASRLDDGSACVLVSGEDVAGLVGAHLHREIGARYPVIAVDCVDLTDFDFVDVGARLARSNAVPIVIKSLVFPQPVTGGDADRDTAFDADRDTAFYAVDNIHLTSVGIDIGSSTMSLTASAIHLRRDAEEMSSRYRVVDTTVIWRSGIALTPYRDDETIDADTVAGFIAGQYASAGLRPGGVDTGAVILTGVALAQRNARALADAVAAAAGAFVCVSAGHQLEAVLTAHGSGAVALSRQRGQALLCVDIGGGTTKLSLLRDGEVIGAGAIAVGARSVAWAADRTVTRSAPGSRIVVGQPLTEPVERDLVEAALAPIRAVLSRRPGTVDPALLLTGELDPRLAGFDAVVFAGGVSEYVYGRQHASFGDLGQGIGAALRDAIADGSLGVAVLDPGVGIWATVVGAAEHTAQVSGSTVASAGAVELPLRDVLVVHPDLDPAGDFIPAAVARAVGACLDAAGDRDAIGLALRFTGPPEYRRLRGLAGGIADALARPGRPATLVVLVDADIAGSLGRLLAEARPPDRGTVCLDNLALAPFDHVDIGPPVPPNGVYPVVIKSLLFARSR